MLQLIMSLALRGVIHPYPGAMKIFPLRPEDEYLLNDLESIRESTVFKDVPRFLTRFLG